MAWWVVFLAVLPIGVTTQADQGEIVPGTMSGAPINPNLGKKVIWATYGGAGVTFVFWCVMMLIRYVF